MLVLDVALGVRTASIGIREGRITAVGRAGNPDTTDGVDVVVGTGSIIVPGEGMIATAGAIDTHVHLLSPRICEAALSSGVTTILGQEFGPFWGVGVNSAWALRSGWSSFDAWPVNIGFLGRGSSSRPEPLLEALGAGVCAFKVHEDLGAHARSLDTALTVAEEHDVQVCVHTDGLNENLALADTLDVLDGRTVHAYHVEGCGGGHVPDVLELAGVPHVIGSSTNPTLPFGRDAVAEHEAMIVAVHGLRPELPGEARLARDRVRAATMAAETLLHDLGVIPITSSDAQGMGRAGETVRRTFAMAAVAKGVAGARRRRRRRRQRPGAALPGEADAEPRDRARHRARGGVAGAGQAGGRRPVAAGVVRRQAAPRRQGRAARRGARSATPTPPSTRPSPWCSGRSSAGRVPRRPSSRWRSSTPPRPPGATRSAPRGGGSPSAGRAGSASRTCAAATTGAAAVRVAGDGSRVTFDGEELRMDPVSHVPLARLYHF